MAKSSKKPKTPFSNAPLDPGPFVRSKDFKTIYANTVKMSFTAFECRMTLVHVSDAVGLNQFVQQEEAMVVMHPVHAKILQMQLQKALDLYEQQIGPLNVPEEAKQAFKIS